MISEVPGSWIGHVTNLLSQSSVLFQELDDAVGQLRVVHAKTLHLVKRNQNTSQEELVLFLERQGEAVDNRSQNFQQLRDTIETLRFIDELEEHVVDRSPNVGSEVEEFAVNAVKSRLEEIALSGVLGIE